MKSRTRKYRESRKENSGDEKGSASNAGYDEQNEKTIRAPKQNPAPSEEEEEKQSNQEKNNATQHNTGGKNNSGKKVDDH